MGQTCVIVTRVSRAKVAGRIEVASGMWSGLSCKPGQPRARCQPRSSAQRTPLTSSILRHSRRRYSKVDSQTAARSDAAARYR